MGTGHTHVRLGVSTDVPYTCVTSLRYRWEKPLAHWHPAMSGPSSGGRPSKYRSFEVSTKFGAIQSAPKARLHLKIGNSTTPDFGSRWHYRTSFSAMLRFQHRLSALLDIVAKARFCIPPFASPAFASSMTRERLPLKVKVLFRAIAGTVLIQSKSLISTSSRTSQPEQKRLCKHSCP